MKTAQFLKTLFAIVFMMVVMPSMVLAGQLKSAKVTLTDPRPNPATSTHTFEFTLTTGSDNLEEIQFQYCTGPSGTCSTPTGLITSASTKGTLGATLATADWSLNTGTAGKPILQHTNGGETVSTGDVLSIGVASVTNSAIDACQASKTDTDTCYIKITTCNDLGCNEGEELDYATISYTIVAAVTVSARVDPTFSLTIAGVNAGTGTNGITTSVSSDFNTLPFSNLTAGTPKYAAHKLTVTTNTDTGYTVKMKMVSQMTGVYAGDIDPYAANGASWSNPIAWTEPTGSTPNTNTGWIGANTNDTDVDNWTGDTKSLFGPVNGTENLVMKKTSSDNGSTSVYVSYAIEVNVYQPSDTYTGTLFYNALPTY